MALEYMINPNTGQIDSRSIGYSRPQFAAYSTNKESNSIKHYNSKKSASNFNSALLHKDNISAQKKNTDNKEKATKTSSRTNEAAPAAATSYSQLEELAAGETGSDAHALGNSSNEQIMKQSTDAQPSTQTIAQEIRLPPSQKSPPSRRPAILRIQPGHTPPSHAARYIIANKPEILEEQVMSQNKDETAHHTTIILYDSQPPRQDSKHIQIGQFSMRPQKAEIANWNNEKNIKDTDELDTTDHALITLQRTQKKATALAGFRRLHHQSHGCHSDST